MEELQPISYAVEWVANAFGTTNFAALLLATYGVIELIDRQLYGPFELLSVFEKVLTKALGKYCPVCFSFWVALTLMLVMPKAGLYALASTGLYIMVNQLSMEDKGDDLSSDGD